MIDFDSPDQSADDVTATIPVEPTKSSLHSRGELLQPPDDQHEVSFQVQRFDERGAFSLQSPEALLQAAHAWLELSTVNHPFSISIDQATDPPAKSGHLSVQNVDILPQSAASCGVGQSTPIFLRQPPRVDQYSLDLVPDRLLELVTSHRAVVAGGLPTKAVTISTGAAIISVVGWSVAAGEPTRHLSVERITTALADDQTLQ